MTPMTGTALLAAGVGGGLCGSVAGLASLVSYPALLAVGLSPVTANVTNTISLVFSGVGSVHGSRHELSGQNRRLIRLSIFSVLGGAVGGVILLISPAAAFERLVPLLIGLASVVLLIPRRRTLRGVDGVVRDPSWLSVAVFAIAVYGGYFGAAAGVILLAALLAIGDSSFARPNAIKNLLLGLANLIAAIVFALFSSVDWLAATPLAVGFLIGGRIGPVIVRRVPVRVLRIGIGAAGLGLAVVLLVQSFA